MLLSNCECSIIWSQSITKNIDQYIFTAPKIDQHCMQLPGKQMACRAILWTSNA